MPIRTALRLSGALVIACYALARQPPPPAPSFPDAEKELEAVLAEISAAEAAFNERRKPRDKECVKRRLEHLFKVDQRARAAWIKPRPEQWSAGARDYYGKKLANRIIALDRANAAELEELLKTYRWITISEFGEKAEGHAWLIVQHADRDVRFQQEVLEILGALYPLRETTGSNYANLWDRVARNTGKLQRYGTQGRCAGPGEWEPFEVEDPARLDQLRASVGLSTMAEYLQRSRDRGYCP